MKNDRPSAPARAPLRVRDGIALTVGMVVGIGIFKAPALVATGLQDQAAILALWAAGGLIVLLGALCYAELASSHPDTGGEYAFLVRAYGPATGFLLAWGRLAVVQTGAIATVAFVFGDYAQRLVPLGPAGPALYAALSVVAVTGLNIRGTRVSAHLQNLFALFMISAVLVAALLGFLLPAGAPPPRAVAPAGESGVFAAIGFAMIFVMLTYGGWNEAAYLSAELRGGRRAILGVLMGGTLLVTALYLLINAAYLRVLTPAAMRASDAVGADYMRALLGAPGDTALSLIVVAAALTTLNATIFTGARSAYALGCDTPLFGALGRWNGRAEGPVAALRVQAALALALVALGAAARQGFATMVEYTAPVFWFFLLLVGCALFVLRRRGLSDGAFRVPLYPATPALFCASSLYMLYASLAHTGTGALLGVGVLALGLPVWVIARRGMAAQAR